MKGRQRRVEEAGCNCLFRPLSILKRNLPVLPIAVCRSFSARGLHQSAEGLAIPPLWGIPFTRAILSCESIPTSPKKGGHPVPLHPAASCWGGLGGNLSRQLWSIGSTFSCLRNSAE